MNRHRLVAKWERDKVNFTTYEECLAWWEKKLEEDPFDQQLRNAVMSIRQPEVKREMEKIFDKRAFKDHGAGI